MYKANYQGFVSMFVLYDMFAFYLLTFDINKFNMYNLHATEQSRKIKQDFSKYIAILLFYHDDTKIYKKKELKLWPHSGMHFCRLYVTEHYPKRKEMAREKECFKFSQFIHLDTHEMWVE